MGRKGMDWMGLGYLVPFYTSLALAFLGAIMFFAGASVITLIWIYTGVLAALVAYAAVGAVDAFYKKVQVEVEVPKVAPEEKVIEPVAEKR